MNELCGQLHAPDTLPLGCMNATHISQYRLLCKAAHTT